MSETNDSGKQPANQIQGGECEAGRAAQEIGGQKQLASRPVGFSTV